LVDTVSTPQLLRMVEAKQLDPEQLVTHHFAMADMMDAYDVFSRAAETKALKVIIEAADPAAARSAA
jgi:alcohol dehydrogenase